MRKFLISITLLTAVLLTACGQAATPAPTAAPTASPTKSGAVCTVVSKPKTGATPVSRFPAATDEDWALGPSTASVTFMEYSDFQ